MDQLVTRPVRNEPIQQRSAERINNLLNSAAELIDKNGIDRLTTSDVALQSGSSVGVLYRYFPNIQSLLRTLAARNLERFTVRVHDLLSEDKYDIRDGVNAVIDSYLDSYLELSRNEPGFRALRFGSIIDERAIPDRSLDVSVALIDLFSDLLTKRFSVTLSPELLLELEVMLEIGDALLRRAFRIDPQGDARFITRLRKIVADFPHWGNSA